MLLQWLIRLGGKKKARNPPASARQRLRRAAQACGAGNAGASCARSLPAMEVLLLLLPLACSNLTSVPQIACLLHRVKHCWSSLSATRVALGFRPQARCRCAVLLTAAAMRAAAAVCACLMRHSTNLRCRQPARDRSLLPRWIFCLPSASSAAVATAHTGHCCCCTM